MQDLFLGNNHDITLVNNDLGVRKDALTVTAQCIETRLKLFLGEWNLDTTLGIPYFQAILGQKVDKGLISSYFMSEIAKERNVKSVDDFSVKFEGRRFEIEFKCALYFGGILEKQLGFEV